MLLTMKIKNWKTFKNEVTFSMEASRERKHSNQVARLSSMYGKRRVLPAAAIFGYNAAGKTSLLEALSFLKNLVVIGTQVNQAIPVRSYQLDQECSHAPTFIELRIVKEGHIYRYAVSLTRGYVEKEQLFLERTRSEELIFSRLGDRVEFGKMYDTERHRFIAESTRRNQLFLHNAVEQNAESFRPAFDWFAAVLRIEGVEDHGAPYTSVLVRDDFRQFINEKLRDYGTGAEELSLDHVPKEAIGVPVEFLDSALAAVPPGEEGSIQIRVDKGDAKGPEIYIIMVRDSFADYYKATLRHRCSDGEGIRFEMGEESTGTQRLVELLPIFFDLCAKGTPEHSHELVWLIDELERSFHTSMTLGLVREYLDSCNSNTRHQLIFTTHDLLLMSDDSMRRDELWVCSKDPTEGSEVVCIGKHPRTRTDSDILKLYMEEVYR